MDKDVKAILAGISLALVIFNVHACKTSESATDRHYQDTIQMTQSERNFLAKGKIDLKEMKHLTKRVWVRK